MDGTHYKLSRFTVIVDLAEHGPAGYLMIFNTHSRRCVLLRREDWDDMVAGLDGSPTTPAVGAAIEQLARSGIVVGTHVDERRAYQADFDHKRYNPPRIYPIFAVSTACNLACTYCYEEGVQYRTMSDEVVRGVIDWVGRRMADDGMREIYPALFGGEPLMYPKILFALMDGINRLRDEHGATVVYSCSTNGTFLTPELARDLAARGLEQIQISLDGPAAIHDVRRLGKRGQGSFETSVRALEVAVETIRSVTVKINFDDHNLAHGAEVFDFLVQRGWRDRVSIKLEAIAEQATPTHVCETDSVLQPESPALADAYLGLMDEARRRGLRVVYDTAHTTPCMHTAHHGVLIGPQGYIYKCISLVGRPEFSVGTVLEAQHYVEERYDGQMDVWKKTEECFEEQCPYIPVCAGGCSYESIVRTGRDDLRYCTRPFLERFHTMRYLLKHEEDLRPLGLTTRPRLPVLEERSESSAVKVRLPVVDSPRAPVRRAELRREGEGVPEP